MELYDPSAVKKKPQLEAEKSTKIKLFSQQNKFTIPKTKPKLKTVNATQNKAKKEQDKQERI